MEIESHVVKRIKAEANELKAITNMTPKQYLEYRSLTGSVSPKYATATQLGGIQAVANSLFFWLERAGLIEKEHEQEQQENW